MLNKKTVIITGGTRGIGKAIAKKMAEEGYAVLVTYQKNEQQARAFQEEMIEAGAAVSVTQCDVRNLKESRTFVEQIVSEYSTIDVLINNAGITKDGLIRNMNTEDFKEVLDVNLTGMFQMTKLVSKQMLKQRKGRIINLASISGIIGIAGQANYSASKAGVIGFTKSCAKEFAYRNITVNAIAPGFIETDMNNRLPEHILLKAKEEIPLHRFGKASEVAEVAAFLASEGAAYITGQVIQVNGGIEM